MGTPSNFLKTVRQNNSKLIDKSGRTKRWVGLSNFSRASNLSVLSTHHQFSEQELTFSNHSKPASKYNFNRTSTPIDNGDPFTSSNLNITGNLVGNGSENLDPFLFNDIVEPELAIEQPLIQQGSMNSLVQNSILQNVQIFNSADNSLDNYNGPKCRTELDLVKKHLDMYPLREYCVNCRLKCSEFFSNIRREDIRNHFWNLSFPSRQEFLNGHIQIVDLKMTKPTKSKFSKSHSRKYLLPFSNGITKTVCKTMFLNTLGLSCDAQIQDFIHAKLENNGFALKSETRGKHKQKSNETTQLIIDQINKYHPQVSHYRQLHAPNRRYLPDSLTRMSIWKDFSENILNPKVSYSLFTKIFNKQKITFGEPEADLCDICQFHNLHLKVCQIFLNNIQCSDCEKFNSHHINYNISRKQYKEDQKHDFENTGVFAVDLQKILLIPIMSIKN